MLPHQASRSLQLAVPPLSLQLPIIDSSCIPKRHGGHPPAAHVSQATAQHMRAHTTLLSTQLPLCCLTKPAALCSWQCHHLVCCCQMTAAAIESATEDISPGDARNPSNGTAQAGTHCVVLHAVAALLPHQTSCSLQLAVPPLSLLLPIIDGSCNRKRL